MSKKFNHGKMHSTVGNRSDGRKIDTWTFVEHIQNVPYSIEFEVFLKQDMTFIVKTNGIDKHAFTSLSGTDLQILFENAEEAARKEFDIRLNISWSDWLEVCVSERGRLEAETILGSNLGISYRTIPRGETPDGQAFTINFNNILVPFPKNVGVVSGDTFAGRKDESVQIGDKMKISTDIRDAKAQFTYIPDTTENRLGLDNLIFSLENLGRKVQEFLAPEKINQTLQRSLENSSKLLGYEENKKTDYKRKSTLTK